MDDLKKIKNEYGEKMMYFCRDNFPTILETPGLLYETLKNKFYPSKLLYKDIENNSEIKECFLDIISNALPKKEKEEKEVTKTAKELLDEAGYILYECHSEKDIQSFRKYYKRSDGEVLPEYVEGEEPDYYDGEELCTFNGNRLERCHVFFAVKKNVDEIKRENFPNPKRDDEYGTSVISIQFSRGSNNNSISIKNRYNHTVDNPDATFSNNLDNIISGLSQAFEQDYGFKGLKAKSVDTPPGYILANDGRYYKFNIEIDNIYYCPDNIIIDNGEVTQLDKSRYLLFEYILIDFKEKKISICNDIIEGFALDFLDNELNSIIKSIKVEVDKTTKEKTITINGDIIIKISQTNRITYYKNDHVKVIADRFLCESKYIEKVDLPNVEIILNRFLEDNIYLKELNLPKCKYIGDHFLRRNRSLKVLSLPELRGIGDFALKNCQHTEELYLPNVEEIGECFLESNKSLTKLDLPNVKKIGNRCLIINNIIEKINLPELEIIGDCFLECNHSLIELNLPKCKEIKGCFMTYNESIKKINLPEVEKIGVNFLSNNKKIKVVDLPNITYIDGQFLYNNKVVNKLRMPKVKYIDSDFMPKNERLIEVILPEVETIQSSFLHSNKNIRVISLPKCTVVGNAFLHDACNLQEAYLPLVEEDLLEEELVQKSNSRK